ncbi:unnamed protein product [Caenorhabditis nigoni]
MGNLKEDLKSAASLLKSGNNEEVIELLEEHIDDTSPDYRVFCFIALAYSNIQKYDDSYQMYKKAVEIDEANLMAWKGLFKLFEAESHTTPDQFALRVCEFMQKNGEDKKDQAAQARRRIHVEMGLWKEIMQNFDEMEFGADSENLRRVVQKISSQPTFEPLLERCFQALEDTKMLEKDADTMLLYCKFKKTVESLRRLVENHKDVVTDDWVQKKLFEYSCQQYFASKDFPEFVKYVSKISPATKAVLNELRENDIPAAIEALDSVTDHSAYPDSLLFIGLIAETENWEAVEKLARSIFKVYPSAMCNGWIARALLEISPDSPEKLRALGNLPLPEFAVERMKIAVLTGKDNHIQLLEQCEDPKSAILLRLTKILYSKDPVTSEEVKLAEQLPSDSCQNLLVTAEIRIRAGLDANPYLVKAAKLNVRCSRAFYLLAQSLSAKNPTKAKSLVERAIQICPPNGEYTKLLYDLLTKKGATAEEKLKVLETQLSDDKIRRRPFWLSDALTTLYLETGKLTEAIEELQRMVRLYPDNKIIWARLADAYTRKGHLMAAVSSYTQLAEMKDGHEFYIPIVRIMLQLRQCDEALDKIIELREKIETENLVLGHESIIVLNFTEAEVRLNLHEKSCGEQKLYHLKNTFSLLTKCIDNDGGCQYSTVFKLLGDALMVVSNYASLQYFEIEETWEIETPLDCVTKALSFYMAVLRFEEKNALGWYDVSISLLAKYKFEKDQNILVKVQQMLEHALSLTTDNTLLSSIWTLLAEAKRNAEDPISHQLHCLARALELNKSNDKAWLSTAVLCLSIGRMNEASRLLEQAIKYDPQNADAWCTWAQTAHLQGVANEALAMFRQALYVRPTLHAVVGYSSYLCNSLKKSQHRFDSATAALDFEPIADLRFLVGADSNILYHLGLLADLFGWYPESLECFKMSKSPKIVDEIAHALIKANVLYGVQPAEEIHCDSRICGMQRLGTEDCYAFLTAEMDVYGDLYRFIESNDSVAFKKLYMSCVKAISVPLFISGLIVKKITLPSEFIRTMHEALPRHELIDYFPTVLPEGVDNGLRHLEQDGEEPFRYRHRSNHRLLEELKALREKYEEENPRVEDPEPNLETIS